ncbi:FAD-dependent oxidoreductase [Chitinasiproducens palmae]|uniref:Rieske [2Fe-2S] domain-containing protein n=1 Tax=Chitinasiproducens palmae TaxID=1770053 RepID=A0A1H2PUY6_9BURK|nr:FAD-dependent oxidoreductase [Chitinasiproducens palmae]SDV51046.1 Rieske [2Fe-2S] domain-containing protein [Chitinasiproducens palmae]
MLPMTKVAAVVDVPIGGARRVEVAGRAVMLIRDDTTDRPAATDGADATIRAYSAECPHAGAPLDEGAFCAGRVICPWHKSVFRLDTGALIEPPALDPLPRFAVAVRDGDVYLSPEPLPASAGDAGDAESGADTRRFVIVGGGAAGICAATSLREFGFAGDITLITGEPQPAYDRTALSKFVVAGEMAADEVPPLRDAQFLAEHRIDVEPAHALRLDARRKQVGLADGRSLSFDRALIATGATPVRPALPGAYLRGAHVLRTREDADAISHAVSPGTRVVLLGNSFIAMEAASAMRGNGADVMVVAPSRLPFVKQFGADVGKMFAALHARHGVRLCAAEARALEGDSAVSAVRLDSGERLPADCVVLGVGVRPASEVVEGVALEGDAIAVDAGMRTSADDVFAAGDVAAFPLPGTAQRQRVEHWRVAQEQARLAARNMLGARATYEGVPYFWTYHYGQRYDYLGHADGQHEVHILGDLSGQRDDARFAAIYLRAGQVRAVLAGQYETQTAYLLERMRAPLTLEEVLAVLQREH